MYNLGEKNTKKKKLYNNISIQTLKPIMGRRTTRGFDILFTGIFGMKIEMKKIQTSYRGRASMTHMYNGHKAHTKSGNDLKLHTFKFVA